MRTWYATMEHRLTKEIYNNLDPHHAYAWKEWVEDMWDAVASIQERVPDSLPNPIASYKLRICVAADFVASLLFPQTLEIQMLIHAVSCSLPTNLTQLYSLPLSGLTKPSRPA